MESQTVHRSREERQPGAQWAEKNLDLDLDVNFRKTGFEILVSIVDGILYLRVIEN